VVADGDGGDVVVDPDSERVDEFINGRLAVLVKGFQDILACLLHGTIQFI
jgi:hypothetical protein